MGNNFQPRINNDRFGRPYQLKFAAQVYSKKEKRVLEDIYKTRVELGGKEYEIEVSPASKTKEIKGETRNGLWVKVTKVDAVRRTTSM